MTDGDAQLLDWLRLARSENVGPATFRSLLRRFGDPAAALAALPDLAARGGLRRPIRVCGAPQAERELEAGRVAGAQLVTLADPRYPALLAAVDPAPPLFWALGPALGRLDRRSVAVIGARNASAIGLKLAAHIAREAVADGFTVVAGLARGLDAAAHGGALAADEGRVDAPTVAVLAGGVDQPYPAQNEPIYRAIVERGLALSEAPPGLQAAARHFPRRNRLISGLSLGVLIMEAAERSGSLITARHAAEQGREVLAAPGHPSDPRAAGTNALLREGATLVRHWADLREALEPQLAGPRADARDRLLQDRLLQDRLLEERACPPGRRRGAAEPERGALSDAAVDRARAALLQLLSHAPIAVDDLFRAAALGPAEGAAALLELELAGLAEREPGGAARLASGAEDETGRDAGGRDAPDGL